MPQYPLDRLRADHQPKCPRHAHKRAFFFAPRLFGGEDDGEVAVESGFFEFVADFAGEGVAVAFPDACHLYFGGVDAFGGAQGHDELAVAALGHLDLDPGGVGGVDDQVVGVEVEALHPGQIHLLADGFDARVELGQSRDFALAHRAIGADLAVAVALVVGVVVDDGDLPHPRAVEAVQRVAPHPSDPQNEDPGFLDFGEILLAEEHAAAVESHGCTFGEELLVYWLLVIGEKGWVISQYTNIPIHQYTKFISTLSEILSHHTPSYPAGSV